MEERDLQLRNLTYGLFVELGRAPTAAEVSTGASIALDEAFAGWRRLHAAHALVLDLTSGELLMAHPFSAVPTAYRVYANERGWYANCAWDAFGVCAALHSDGRIETTCPDCAEPIVVNVTDGVPDDNSLLFHCLIPALRWWDDIVFT
jgi:hypothetical protein